MKIWALLKKSRKSRHLIIQSEQINLSKQNVFYSIDGRTSGEQDRVNRWKEHQRKLRNCHLMISFRFGPRTTCLDSSHTDLLDAGTESQWSPCCPSSWVAFPLANCLSQWQKSRAHSHIWYLYLWCNVQYMDNKRLIRLLKNFWFGFVMPILLFFSSFFFVFW